MTDTPNSVTGLSPAAFSAPSQVDRLLMVMRRLRAPDGCPWDRVQTFESIVPYTTNEAYEVADAILRSDHVDLRDELGDLLLQVVYHSRIAEEAGYFRFEDVVAQIADKMVRRHPHVFGIEDCSSSFEISSELWEIRKLPERQSRGESGVLAGMVAGGPALTEAMKLTRRAAQVGFDWPDTEAVLEKLNEEVDELRAELLSAEPARLADEVGDILFVVSNLARKLGLDPEVCLAGSNAKFRRRFNAVEGALAARDGRTPAEASLEEMEDLWKLVKLGE